MIMRREEGKAGCNSKFVQITNCICLNHKIYFLDPVQPRETDPQPRGPKGRLYPLWAFNIWFSLTCLMSLTGRDCLSHRLANSRGTGPPPKWWMMPETSSPAKPKKDSNKMKETSTTTPNNAVYINYVSIFFNPPSNTWKMIFTCSLVSAVSWNFLVC